MPPFFSGNPPQSSLTLPTVQPESCLRGSERHLKKDHGILSWEVAGGVRSRKGGRVVRNVAACFGGRDCPCCAGRQKKEHAHVVCSSTPLPRWSGGKKDVLWSPKEKITPGALIQETCRDLAFLCQRVDAVTFAKGSLEILNQYFWISICSP